MTPFAPWSARSAVMLAMLVAICLACGIFRAQAQSTPTQPVRVLVGSSPGSSPDIVARAVSTQLGIELGQQVYVENQSGANTTLAIGTVVKAEPNGTTLLFSLGSIAPIPYVYKNLRFDILRDLVPIATIGVLDGFVMVVHPALPATTVDRLIAYAHANHVVYGSPGVGSTPHLAAETFKAKAGIAMDHVVFRGSGDGAVALLSQSIHMMFVSPPSVLDMVKAGQLRAIALSGGKPLAALPDVPLMREFIADFPISRSWGIYFAPAKTPTAIIDKLNAAIRKTLRAPLVAGVLQGIGYFPDERTPAETAEFFRQEVEATGEAVRLARIQPN